MTHRNDNTTTAPYRVRLGNRWWYRCPAEIRYYSARYDRWVVVPEDRWSDGATGALDMFSRAWWIHDELCNTGHWAGGTSCDNWQASTVLSDVLREEGRALRAVGWWGATWLFGGGKCRKVGTWPRGREPTATNKRHNA